MKSKTAIKKPESTARKFLESLIYASFILPTAFFITIAATSTNITGQEEVVTDLTRVFSAPPLQEKIISLGVLGCLSLILCLIADHVVFSTDISDYKSKEDMEIEQENSEMFRGILYVAGYSIQFYLLYIFASTEFNLFPLNILKILSVVAGIILASNYQSLDSPSEK